MYQVGAQSHLDCTCNSLYFERLPRLNETHVCRMLYPKPVQVFHKSLQPTSWSVNITLSQFLQTFPSVQGGDNKIPVITGISGDFWKDFIRTQKEVITKLILKLLHICKYPGSDWIEWILVLSAHGYTCILVIQVPVIWEQKYPMNNWILRFS